MEAFFGCLYYAALRPAEAVALREADCILPARGWGRIDPAASQLRAEHGVAVLLKVYASCIEGQAGSPTSASTNTWVSRRRGRSVADAVEQPGPDEGRALFVRSYCAVPG